MAVLWACVGGLVGPHLPETMFQGFGTGQRKLYRSELRKLDVHCRKFLR